MDLPGPIASVMRAHAEAAAGSRVNAEMRAQPKAMGYVYLILGARNRVKIGWALDPKDRRRRLQTGSADSLILLAYWPGTVKDERALHRRFDKHRINASEWFNLRGEVQEFLTGKMTDAFRLARREAAVTMRRKKRRLRGEP